MLHNLPGLIIHADWSVSNTKRWYARAILQQDGTYYIDLPHPASKNIPFLAETLHAGTPEQALLFGFDFPIGLPQAYAEKAGITDFLTFLDQAGKGEWNQFFQPAGQPEEISILRPFYPNKAGKARQTHLLEALGISNINDLRRKCELAHANRRSAAPLFWTMGAQQVGKAALQGWREVLIPGLAGKGAKLWPYSGALDELLAPGRIVMLETYPAEFYTSLGLVFSPAQVMNQPLAFPQQTEAQSQGFGKRSQAGRRANAPQVLQRAHKAGIVLSDHLQYWLTEGCGSKATAEDAFDAVIGLIGMIAALRTWEPARDPASLNPTTQIWLKIEGWIFGQAFPA